MQLTEKALTAIRNKKARIRLAMELQCTEQTIQNYIDANSDNLTKVAALKVIQQVTGLPLSEILDEKFELA